MNVLQNRWVRSRKTHTNSTSLSLRLLTILLLCAGLFLASFKPQQNKIQESINVIKEAYYSETEAYHTDGHRTVWVKSYKNWVPQDFQIMRTEAPDVLKFLNQAASHNRLDVLEQLLPGYYRTHGGAQAFAIDIKKAATNH